MLSLWLPAKIRWAGGVDGKVVDVVNIDVPPLGGFAPQLQARPQRFCHMWSAIWMSKRGEIGRITACFVENLWWKANEYFSDISYFPSTWNKAPKKVIFVTLLRSVFLPYTTNHKQMRTKWTGLVFLNVSVVLICQKKLKCVVSDCSRTLVLNCSGKLRWEIVILWLICLSLRRSLHLGRWLFCRYKQVTPQSLF